MDPIPAMTDNEPSAILIFLFPAHGLQEQNNFKDPDIWSVAPESIIHEQYGFEFSQERAAMKQLPFFAKEQEGFENCGDWKSLYMWLSCSFVKECIFELTGCP